MVYQFTRRVKIFLDYPCLKLSVASLKTLKRLNIFLLQLYMDQLAEFVDTPKVACYYNMFRRCMLLLTR